MTQLSERFHWVTPETRAAHPDPGERVVPHGPWEFAELVGRETGRVAGEAWFAVREDVLRVIARLSDEFGPLDEPTARHWIGRELFGADGFTMGFYEASAVAVVVEMIDLDTRYVWSWRDLEPIEGPDAT